MANGVLEFRLFDARGLQDSDFSLLNNRNDPYVVIKYRNQEQKSNVAKDQGNNPTWNESFKFRVLHKDDGSRDKVFLRIMDHDTFSKHDFLGEASIHVSDLIAIGMENGFSELKPSRYRVVLADGRYSGDIRLSVIFTKKEYMSMM